MIKFNHFKGDDTFRLLQRVLKHSQKRELQVSTLKQDCSKLRSKRAKLDEDNRAQQPVDQLNNTVLQLSERINARISDIQEQHAFDMRQLNERLDRLHELMFRISQGNTSVTLIVNNH